MDDNVLRIGIGGPVGSGKTALIEALVPLMIANGRRPCVVTNDIYTREDAEFLLRNAVLPPERIQAVETGACPHTAIRDDISANLEAVEDLEDAVGPLDLILVESGGDNLTLTFSPALADVFVFVLDTAEGEKMPRKRGPGITDSDLLVINKTDIAQYVRTDLGVMESDAHRVREDRPVLLTDCLTGAGVADVAGFLESRRKVLI
ncbi:urease accessory protein UreG [Streptomyces cavourensis]|nr:urease accessory protein UreG [Streptomyces cavourensis]